jgi:hypothetical protein
MRYLLRHLLLLLLLCTAAPASAQVTFTSSDLPIIVINTGSQQIADDPRITCDMGIIYNGPGLRNYMSDPFNHYNGKINIEIRGSTSQQYPKKSYGLETIDLGGNNFNTSLLGMPQENDWILYGAYPDKTLMRNEMTYYFSSLMGHYGSRTRYCELVIDGYYMGVYTLMERIKRDDNRVDIAKLTVADTTGDELTGGYIIKVDKTTGSGTDFWTSPYSTEVIFQYHDPEDIELLPVQKNYIQDYVTDFENALAGPGFADTVTGYRHYIDVLSFIDFMLLQELGRTVDGYRSSSFLYKDKDSKGGKLTAGPMWDFNLSFGNADYCDAYDTTGWHYNFNIICPQFPTEVPFWWARFLQDPAFTAELKCRWQQLRAGILHSDSVDHYIDSVAAVLDESQGRNFIQWPILGQYVNWNYYIGQTYADEIAYLKWWFKARSAWMDINIPGTCNGVYAGAAPVTGPGALKVYPNPFSSAATVKLPLPGAGPGSLSIYNSAGQLVHREDFTGSEVVLHREKLRAGVYSCSVVTNAGQGFSTSLVVLPE